MAEIGKEDLSEMMAFTVNSKGAFMSKLLSSDTFDSFLLEEARIKMGVSYVIDGHLNRDFYSPEEWEEAGKEPSGLTEWSAVRATCRDLIKGKRAPSAFSFVFHLKSEYMDRTLAEVPADTRNFVQALLLNIRLDSTGLHLVTGVSMRGFTTDRSPEKVWDRTVSRFLAARGIDTETN